MIKLIQAKEGTVAVLKNDTHLSRWIEEKGTLKTDWLLDIILPMVKSGDHIIDAGANVGDWTVALSEAAGPTGMVYAYEPMPATFACLVVNTRDCENVKCFNQALTNAWAIESIAVGENVGASHLTPADPAHTPIITTRLDTYPKKRLDWIKIDVEGCEFLLLLGANQTIKAHKPKIICELNRGALSRMGVKPKDVVNLMETYGYRMEFFDPSHNLGQEQLDVLFVPR